MWSWHHLSTSIPLFNAILRGFLEPMVHQPCGGGSCSWLLRILILACPMLHARCLELHQHTITVRGMANLRTVSLAPTGPVLDSLDRHTRLLAVVWPGSSSAPLHEPNAGPLRKRRALQMVECLRSMQSAVTRWMRHQKGSRL